MMAFDIRHIEKLEAYIMFRIGCSKQKAKIRSPQAKTRGLYIPPHLLFGGLRQTSQSILRNHKLVDEYPHPLRNPFKQPHSASN